MTPESLGGPEKVSSSCDFIQISPESYEHMMSLPVEFEICYVVFGVPSTNPDPPLIIYTARTPDKPMGHSDLYELVEFERLNTKDKLRKTCLRPTIHSPVGGGVLTVDPNNSTIIFKQSSYTYHKLDDIQTKTFGCELIKHLNLTSQITQSTKESI